jgi:hypothetical protein
MVSFLEEETSKLFSSIFEMKLEKQKRDLRSRFFLYHEFLHEFFYIVTTNSRIMETVTILLLFVCCNIITLSLVDQESVVLNEDYEQQPSFQAMFLLHREYFYSQSHELILALFYLHLYLSIYDNY